MVRMQAILDRFDEKGEKTGWTFIIIPAAQARKINPDNLKAFRIRGKIDQMPISQVAIMPMGEGDYILPVNAAMRKTLRKKDGDKVVVEIEMETTELPISPDLVECLKEEKNSWKKFSALAKGHQRYFSNWVESAKTAPTKADRIAKCLFAMQNDMDYGQMIRHFKGKKD